MRSARTVVEARLPDLPYGALMNVVYAEAAAAFEQLTLTDADDTLTWQADGAWPNTFRKARFLSAVDHVQLDRLRYLVMQALDGLFREVDALIGPFMTGPMLVASNFTGHPCLHLRAGFADLPARGEASLGAGRLTTGEARAETASPDRAAGRLAVGPALSRGPADGAGPGARGAARRRPSTSGDHPPRPTRAQGAPPRRSDMRRRHLFTLSAVALAAALAGPAAAQDEPRSGGTLVWGHSETTQNLDIHQTGTASTGRVLENVHDAIVTVDDELTVVPSLAESFEQSEDGLTYTFRLREGVTFHDGSELTSADVKYSFERVMDPETGAVNFEVFNDVASIETPDDLTVVVTLNQVNAPFLSRLAENGAGADHPRGLGRDAGNGARGRRPLPLRAPRLRPGGRARPLRRLLGRPRPPRRACSRARSPSPRCG